MNAEKLQNMLQNGSPNAKVMMSYTGGSGCGIAPIEEVVSWGNGMVVINANLNNPASATEEEAERI